MAWRTVDLVPTANAKYDADALAKEIGNHDNSVVNRNRPSFTLSWLRRMEKGTPIILSSLMVNNVSLINLPAECFVEYQLRAQKIGSERFVATAAYGDGGPWYIPTKEEYPTGGYECSVAFCDPSIDGLLTEGMKTLMA